MSNLPAGANPGFVTVIAPNGTFTRNVVSHVIP